MSKANTPKKAFTAEILRRKRLGLDEPDGKPAPAKAATLDASGLDELRQVKEELRHLSHLVRTHFEPEAAPEEADVEDDPIVAEYERMREEVRLLKMELKALFNSIQETKREIAQLRSSNADSDRLMVVASELDAVVGATEGATEGILDAAEKIDHAAQNIRSHGVDTYVARVAEEIGEHILTIFEHCNFQDITGQRITKVVNTLKFVEERIDKMIEIWGREAFDDLLGDDFVEDDDKRLLNGPQLEHKGISQDEIDKLFD